VPWGASILGTVASMAAAARSPQRREIHPNEKLRLHPTAAFRQRPQARRSDSARATRHSGFFAKVENFSFAMINSIVLSE
jgi:hypothetical protein